MCGVGIMMEKEIKAYGDRKDTIIRFVKTDNVKLGKVFVLYPNEWEDIQTKIKDLELEIAILKSKNAELKEQLGQTSTNYDSNALIDRLDSIENRLDKLESDKKR